jgi:translation initiation factor IF-3
MAKDRADYKKQQKKNWVRHNEQIRIPQILVVQDGNNLGVMQTRDALALARSVGLDLVEVAPHSRPPVCQIMDYGKYMFDKSKKEKQKSTQQKEKEICFRYVIDEHDLETKANQAKKFLEKGMKVKLVVKFKAREKAHKDLGFDVLRAVIEKLKDVSSVEIAPKFEGANVMARLDVKKDHKKE